MTLTLAPDEAWEPLPAAQWNRESARHLLRRTGWTATPSELHQCVTDGLVKTLDRLFPSNPASFAKPALIENLEEDSPAFRQRINSASEQEKRRMRREARERSQQALQDLSLRWLQQASRPGHAAFEKWVLFLSDIYVIASSKVQNTGLIYAHHEILRKHAFGRAPSLAKAVSRSPGMIVYLDLQQSKAGAPNENFARELLELFTLGEGLYTERDIKEAARAFTGYRQRQGRFIFAKQQADTDAKTILGQTGRYDGDAVIDLIFKTPAATTFLPRELIKFYLSDMPLPAPYLDRLGAAWHGQEFNLRWLAHRFFSSRLFFDPQFRGNFIKSPLQFYLGLMIDLDLDVAPLARRVLNPLRQTGQILFNPPNVRGWVGGRAWINSTTLDARRQTVQRTFAPLDEDDLNADEQARLAEARAAGEHKFTVSSEWLAALVQSVKSDPADSLIENFIPANVSPSFRETLRIYLRDSTPANRIARCRNALIVLFQSPDYQLC